MSGFSQVSGSRAARRRAGADGRAEVAVHPRDIRTIAQGLGKAARAVEFLRETAPCADQATTKGSAAAPNTRGRRRAHRRRAGAPGFKSPPAASRPGGSRSACSSGGNQSGSACSLSQMSLLRAAIPRRVRDGRAHALDRCGVTIDAARLARRKVADGGGKARVGDEMRRAHQASARNPAAPCARPESPARSAAISSRCSIRCLGSSRSRNAGCGNCRRHPSSDRTSASAPTKNMATAIGSDPIRATLSISRSGMEAAIRLKKSRFKIRFVAVPIEGVGVEGIDRIPQRIVHIAAVQSVESIPASATRRRSRFAFLRFSAVNVARKASNES